MIKVNNMDKVEFFVVVWFFKKIFWNFMIFIVLIRVIKLFNNNIIVVIRLKIFFVIFIKYMFFINKVWYWNRIYKRYNGNEYDWI